MNRTQLHEAFKDLAEPLHEAERQLAKLPNRVRLGAVLLHVDKEQVTDLLEKLDRVSRALKDFHCGCESIAKANGMDVTVLSGGGGNKPPALD